jgi:Tol biopolymer transport system component
MTAILGGVFGSDTTERLTRLTVLPPPGATVYPDSAQLAISPDGTMVAYVVGDPTKARTELWVRSLDSTSARRLDEADGAILPFWSPDSRRIGFFTVTQLKTIAAAGGRADVLCDAPDARGGSWNASNDIVFAPDAGGPLFRVPASGGTPVQVTALDQDKKESSDALGGLGHGGS